MTSLPTLYKKTSTGAIEQWSIYSRELMEGYGAEIVSTHGQVGGHMQPAMDRVTRGKNIGKKNETTPAQQAEAEAKSRWDKKKKTGYVESIEQAQAGQVDEEVITGGISPMLAHVYEKQGHKIKFPAYVQPKLDGHRCIAVIKNGKCTLWSRTQKPITSVPHIVKELERVYTGTGLTVFDGELYNHAYRDKFEELSSLIRQVEPKEGHEAVQYWIYDFPSCHFYFHERDRQLDVEAYIGDWDLHTIRFVDTAQVKSEENMFETFAEYLDEGFEGLMVRNADSLYENKRSYGLQKVKVQQDGEFEIVGVNEGRGKMAGKAIFVCKTLTGAEFSAKMKGSIDALAKYFEKPELAIGRTLTVQFQDLTAEGIPRFPVGLRFREEV